MYDPVIGRWNGVDPLSENYIRTSPYVYALNSPSKLIDINGEGPGDPIASNYSGTGNLVVIISDAPDDKWDTENLDNSSWDHVIAGSAEDAAEWVETTYGKEGNGINNLVLKTSTVARVFSRVTLYKSRPLAGEVRRKI